MNLGAETAQRSHRIGEGEWTWYGGNSHSKWCADGFRRKDLTCAGILQGDGFVEQLNTGLMCHCVTADRLSAVSCLGTGWAALERSGFLSCGMESQ